MKKTPFYLYLLIGGLPASVAQNMESARYIEVTGKADTSLQPTIYYYVIESVVPEDPFTDYASMSKGDRYTVIQKHKERLQEITRQIKTLLAQEGVAENDYLKKKFDLEEAEPNRLQFKITDVGKLDRIIEKLRAPKFCTGQVYAVYSAFEEEARKDLKLKALRKARAEAIKLLAEAGARPGLLLQMTDKMETGIEPPDNSANYDSGEYTFNRKVFSAATFITVHDARFESVLNKTVYLSQTVTARFLIE